MPILPKFFYRLGASFATVRVAGRLGQRKAAVAAQNETFRQLLRQLAVTQQGRDLGLEAEMDYRTFHTRVALQSYETIAPQIDRIKNGETDVLWPGTCQLFVRSAGATTGTPKDLPSSDAMSTHLRQATADTLLFFARRAKHAEIFRGRHLLYAGSTAMTTQQAPTGRFIYRGNVTAMLAALVPPWAARHLLEPPAKISQSTEPAARLRNTVNRTLQQDISLVAGTPKTLLHLCETVLHRAATRGTPPADLRSVWPNLECVIHGGVFLGSDGDELKRLCGRGAQLHEVYLSAEGFIAVQDADHALGLRLLTHHGIFFEFLPLENFRADQLDTLGTKTVPLSAVQAHVNYVLVMTTPAGLCRYVLGDVVRFLDPGKCRLVYVGRTSQWLHTFGESVMERDLASTLDKVCRQNQWMVKNFHVAPLIDESAGGRPRGRHEWWIELKPGTVKTPTGPILAAALDVELQRINETYARQRAAEIMTAPTVWLVIPGVFAHWMEHNRTWSRHSKIPHCLNDRRIATELAQLAPFNPD